MNWINMLPPYQWLVFALVPPLIFLLYFLKLRRVPLEVPSTFLWSRTIEDLHVNTLWQRLRNNLLLWLQLLAVLLLALACLNPGCRGTELEGDRFIFVIDRSASMAANDGPAQITRLEQARREVATLIDQLDSQDAAMLISFSDTARVEQSYTTNKGLLRNKLQAITQSRRGSDLKEALLAASGLANPGRTSDRESQTDVQVAEALGARLLVFSDGGVPPIKEFRLGNLTAEYRPVGPETDELTPNLGITACSISDQLESDQRLQVFTRIQNSGADDVTARVTLWADEQLIDAQEIPIPGLQSGSLSFGLNRTISESDQPIRLRVQVEPDDALDQDNVAHLVLNPPRLARVMVASDNPGFLEYALTTDRLRSLAISEFQPRSHIQTQEFEEAVLLGKYDLVIFDRCQPPRLPRCNAVYWGTLPPENWSASGDQETTPILDTNLSHPLLFDVQMANVNILSSQVLAGPPGTVTLMESTAGPVMALAPRAGFDDLVIGFPLWTTDPQGRPQFNTDWPRKLSFPFFMQNLVLELGRASTFSQSRSYRPGQAISLQPRRPAEQLTVISPSGQRRQLTTTDEQPFLFNEALETGIYEVYADTSQAPDQLFAVNLLDSRESDLAVRESLELGAEALAGSPALTEVRRVAWPWLVVLALILLSLEWYIYNQRVWI